LRVTKTVNWNGVTPDAGQTFEICITGPSYPTTPDCKTLGAAGGTLTWDNLVPGVYTVRETDPGSAWTVVGSDASATVTVATPGQAAITNTRKLGAFTVAKVVNWNGVTPSGPVTFTVCVNGALLAQPVCKDLHAENGWMQAWDGLAPGDYAISEAPGDEWEAVIEPATVTIAPDGTPSAAVVRVTNTRKLGSLIVTKAVDWNGVPERPVTFRICIAGPSPSLASSCKDFASPDGLTQEWINLAPGKYTVREEGAGHEWEVTVDDGTPIVPVNGGMAAATVTNTHTLGSLVVTKLVVWGAQPMDPEQSFEICVTGPSFAKPNCKTIGATGGGLTWDKLIPGTYTVSETSAGTAWEVQIGESQVDVPAGGQGATTVTNTRLTPSLTVSKASQPGHGQNVKPGDTITYMLTLTNTGNVTLTNVILTDTVPTGTEYVPGSAQPELAISPPPLVWKFAAVGIGITRTASFAVLVGDISGVLAITNVAGISSSETPYTDTNQIVNPLKPAAIDLLSFTAEARPDRAIAVNWVTGYEKDTFGFRLYRSTDNTRANAVLATPEIILGRGYGQAGAAYAWVDREVAAGIRYWYWLQETEVSGKTNEFGPVNARVAAAPDAPFRLYLPIATH
jgi:uncharacterized repeat protein (TIGR01451 family)